MEIDHNLDWSKNMDTVYKKGQSCFYLLRQLRSFNISQTMLRMISLVASAILCVVVCMWQQPEGRQQTATLPERPVMLLGGHWTRTVVLERRMLTILVRWSTAGARSAKDWFTLHHREPVATIQFCTVRITCRFYMAYTHSFFIDTLFLIIPYTFV